MDDKQRIRVFFSKFMDISDLQDGDNIFEKGLLSSLFAMQLVSFVENSWGIGIANDELDLENFKSVDSIIQLVQSKL
ncbi:MAG: acyl carrier protein [Oscillospiraceae bacterium]|jgi:acyl carrier protein|nr:acyl carrier protein [Oscillospiraceae bacterium]